MFARLSRWSPKELLQRDSKYVKNTLYIHLIIIIDCVTMSLYIYIYVHILIYFPLIQTCRLDGWRKKVIRQDQIKAIQESIAGFFNEQVIDSKGEFYFDPTLPWKPS